MIGKDFPPNDFELFGLNLTDPTDFIYDVLMSIISFYFAYKLIKIGIKNKFSKGWALFYLFFALATLGGAFGHLFYNYFHYSGKLIGWILIPLSIYFVEVAMINAHWNPKVVHRGKLIYLIKLLCVYLTFLLILMNINPLEKPQLLFLPIAINSILGLLIGVGFFSYRFRAKISEDFHFIFMGIVFIFPSAFIFLFKINLHQWFSKNDFSHLLMIAGIIFFYIGVRKIMLSSALQDQIDK